jgi:hypothetical protein
MTRNLRALLVTALAFLLGWQLHTHRTVQAQASDENVRYQLQSVGGDSTLTLYYPSTQTIYVYPGAVVGNSILSCAFMYKLGKPGEQVQRVQCPIASIKF